MGLNRSTPRFIHTPSNVFWITVAMLDFPERGGPFKITIWPGVPTSNKPFLLRRGHGPLPGHRGHQAGEDQSMNGMKPMPVEYPAHAFGCEQGHMYQERRVRLRRHLKLQPGAAGHFHL